MEVYEPREDSFLIQKHIKDYAQGNVLDMGTGSGILAGEAAKHAETVIALDISPAAIKHCKKSIKEKNILFCKSDLFEIFELGKIQRKFDLIIFNPPYLPNDKYKNAALDGGKEGYEVTEKFLKNAKNHLNRNGKILLLISSLTKKQKVEKIMKQQGYTFKIIDAQKFSFETLYVYLVKI